MEYYNLFKGGEEWTQMPKKLDIDPSKWKSFLINNVMLKYIQLDSTY